MSVNIVQLIAAPPGLVLVYAPEKQGQALIIEPAAALALVEKGSDQSVAALDASGPGGGFGFADDSENFLGTAWRPLSQEVEDQYDALADAFFEEKKPKKPAKP